jgi:predicted transposase YbfD/YdcC
MHSQSAMPPADAASTVIDVLSARMQDVPVRGQDDARSAGLLVYLGRVPDRRRVRGRRHQLAAILALACGAVTAGAKSLTAIAEWAAAAPAAVLAAFGVRRDRRDGTWVVPSETTIRRTLGGIDADALDAQVGAWLLALAGYGAEEDGAGDQMVIAVDGKTARGAKDKDGTAPHLLAAITCDEVAAIAQQQVSVKSNEIPAFAPLLQDLDLDGAVILADALHTQREHARFIVEDKHADYLFTIKENQPGLFDAVNALPWEDAPVAHTDQDRGHGRDETRTIQVLPAPGDLPFPHAAQVFLIERHVRNLDGSPRSDVAALGVTSLTRAKASPARLAALARTEWTIENGLHYRRSPGAALAVASCGAGATRVSFSC